MLVLTRRSGETILVGDNIAVTVTAIAGDQVRIGVTAPRDLRVLRSELSGRNSRGASSAAAPTQPNDPQRIQP